MTTLAMTNLTMTNLAMTNLATTHGNGDLAGPTLGSRHIAVEGASNFRDFGQYRGSFGTLVGGHLYRSAHLGRLTSGGARQIADLGIATVVDLRGSQERAPAPAAFIENHGVSVVSTPIEPGALPKIAALHAEGQLTGAAMRDLMIDIYRKFASTDAPAFGNALRVIAAEGDKPVLVHCTAGKDRTGFLVALVQHLVGVPEAEIVADYTATNEAWDKSGVTGLDHVDPHARAALLTADPDYLGAAFDTIARTDGSTEAFLDRATDGQVRLDHIHAWLKNA